MTLLGTVYAGLQDAAYKKVRRPGRATPYEIYDMAKDIGWVNVGMILVLSM
jgi:hypothetical protein